MQHPHNVPVFFPGVQQTFVPQHQQWNSFPPQHQMTQRHTRTPDSSENLRRALAVKLNDIERINRIVYDYETILRDAIPTSELKKAFEDWMVGVGFFLGSPYYDHNLFFHHLKDCYFFQTNDTFKIAFEKFSNEIKLHAYPLDKVFKTAHKTQKVAILFPGTGGGGHKAPATAMANFLKEKNIEVLFIDTDEVEKPYDPMIGGLSRGDIYSKIYQVAGDVNKATWMWGEADRVQPLETRRFMSDLTKMIKRFDADHILVAAHHQPHHLSLAYQLGVPLTFVHTDNQLHANLKDLVLQQQELEFPLVSFSVLTPENEFFSELLSCEKKVQYNDLSDRIKKQFFRLNFPIRNSFQPVSEIEKKEVREKLGILPYAVVVKIANGKNGLPQDIKRIMEAIVNERTSINWPLYVFIVCGENKELKLELESHVNNLNKARDERIQFKVLGFLEEKEMAEYDKASDIWITKPGGSTAAEAKFMRKQILYIANPNHMWELTNVRPAEKMDLASRLDFDTNIVEQINHRSRYVDRVEYVQPEGEAQHWKEQLLGIVEKTQAPLLKL